MSSECTNIGDGDLYGLGVRIGLYLQWAAGFLLRNFNGSWETISAVRMANNVLCSTLVLAVIINSIKGTALSTDYLIVYYLTIALFYSESYHLLSGDDDDNGLGCYLRPDVPLVLQNLLFAFATLFGAWFWISGVNHVQPLSCPPKAALFGVFDLDNTPWRRFAAIFAILAGLIVLLFFLMHLYGLLAGLKKGITNKAAIQAAVVFQLYSGHPITIIAMISKVQQSGLHLIVPQVLKYFRDDALLAALASLVLFQWLMINIIGPLIAIVSVERMLQENHLDTSAILQSSGQMIALSTGIAGLCMALWDIWKRHSAKGRVANERRMAGEGNIPNDGGTSQRVSWAAIERAIDDLSKLIQKYDSEPAERDGPQPSSRHRNDYIWQKLGDHGYMPPTPLWWAAEKGHEAVVKLLLAESLIDPEYKNSKGRTALSLAAEHGCSTVVELLLAMDGVDPNSMDSSSRTPLSRASQKGHVEIAKLLLGKGAKIDSKDFCKLTPLVQAAREGHEEVLKLLLDNGADIDSMNSTRRTPLSFAAGNGHTAVAKLLLDRGAEVDSKDDDRQTPVLIAAREGHEAVVKLLLERGAKIAFEDRYGRTPLSWAIQNGHEAVAKLLRDNGATDTGR
jgi:ankyrin repeat protein